MPCECMDGEQLKLTENSCGMGDLNICLGENIIYDISLLCTH